MTDRQNKWIINVFLTILLISATRETSLTTFLCSTRSQSHQKNMVSGESSAGARKGVKHVFWQFSVVRIVPWPECCRESRRHDDRQDPGGVGGIPSTREMQAGHSPTNINHGIGWNVRWHQIVWKTAQMTPTSIRSYKSCKRLPYCILIVLIILIYFVEASLTLKALFLCYLFHFPQL